MSKSKKSVPSSSELSQNQNDAVPVDQVRPTKKSPAPVPAVLSILPSDLSKYERTHIIGLRAEQLARGAQSFVDVSAYLEHSTSTRSGLFFEIAEHELMVGSIPFRIIRKLPDGSSQNLSISSRNP